MNKKNFIVIAAFAAICFAASTVSFGQTATKVQTVGIDPTKNVVQLTNTTANPLPVSVTNASPARKPYQVRTSVGPAGIGFASANVPLPAGKRFVIENISAVTRAPEGIRMEVNFFSYTDSNGDGVGDVQDITFHRIAWARRSPQPITRYWSLPTNTSERRRCNLSCRLV